MTSRARRSLGFVRRNRAYFGWGLSALAVGAAAAAYAWPMVLVERGAREARACLVGYRTVREGPPPACWGAMRYWVTGAKYGWTFHDSTYHGEELKARIAVADYLDASIGSPDASARAHAAKRLAEAEEVVAWGSMRLSMDALGDPIHAPRAGRWAEVMGDDPTLRERWEGLTAWQDRLAAAHAAVDFGDVRLLVRMGRALGELDARDPGLREGAAALLCLEPAGHTRALELLGGLERGRASDRHENFTRELGALRLLSTGCAQFARAPLPGLPELRAGGLEDRRGGLALLGLVEAFRVSRERGTIDEATLAKSRTDATVILDNHEGPILERVGLLAALGATAGLRAGEPAPDLLSYARRVFDDRALGLGKTLSGWALETKLAPLVEGDVYEVGAGVLAKLSAEVGESERALLRYSAGALELEAARAHAFAGRDRDAARAAERGLERVGALAVSRSVTRSTLALLAGDREGGLAELDALAPEELDDSEPSSALGWHTQRAEVLAMLGHPQAAEAAIRAEALAQRHAGSDEVPPSLVLQAQLARLAIAGEVHRSPRAGAVSTPVLLYPRIQTPWMGAARHELRLAWEQPLGVGAPGPLAGAEARARIGGTLESLAAARSGSAGERRVFRYGLFDRRGDFPLFPTFALYLSSLLGPPETDDAEVWLDAAWAVDRERLTHRAYALLRAQAAWMRGDELSGDRWFARLRRLCAFVAEDPRRGPMLSALRW